METSPRPQHAIETELNIEHRKLLNEFCTQHKLTILREEKFNNTLAIVVSNGFEDNREVRIGFPDGVENGIAATDKIKDIKMGMYGHGAWRRSVLE
ncbi:MAG: hypothetical protein KBC21_03685 [Candidatus Pacebacteria bacterium]|nr:hypothetical protein [Candidatus Paceibacterota bacterium]